MNLTLIRTKYASNGIFGEVEGDTLNFLVTLEHAFVSPSNIDEYVPIIPGGEYICQRGIHKLKHSDPFETFEITGIDGHSGLLFHSGNINNDSEGCILLGTLQVGNEILNSHRAFEIFMKWQEGIDSFEISIS